MQRELKLQREADLEWARQVSQRPGCEGLFSCLQCGACSGTCPLSIYMDFSPRRIVALVREGFRKDALSSKPSGFVRPVTPARFIVPVRFISPT